MLQLAMTSMVDNSNTIMDETPVHLFYFIYIVYENYLVKNTLFLMYNTPHIDDEIVISH